MRLNGVGFMRGVESALLTLWVGGLWTVGYIVVPLLFSTLDDRMLAGAVAGNLFTVIGYIGLFCGLFLLISACRALSVYWLKARRPQVISVMLLLVALGLFVLQPMMQELKLLELVKGSPQAARFATLHGFSSVLYLLTSLLGLYLLILSGRSTSAA